MGTGKLYAGGGGNPAMDKHPIRGGAGVELLLEASCYRNQDKLGGAS